MVRPFEAVWTFDERLIGQAVAYIGPGVLPDLIELFYKALTVLDHRRMRFLTGRARIGSSGCE